MCKSVRGAAYFGSSIHLAFSFVFLFWFIFDTLISEININFWKCDPPEQKFSEINPLAHYLNLLFKLLYFTGLSVTGIYVFRGVERERPQLLKYATLAFVIIQILGIIFFPIFFSIQWNTEPDEVPKTAQLIGQEPDVSPCATKCLLPQPTESQPVEKAVTPIVSESVLVPPDLNETTTTTTPLPPPPPLPPVLNETTTTPPSTTTTKAPILPQPPPPPPPPPQQVRRLPHNQLVRLVLQMCFAITNGLVSIAYVIVLALYMVRL